MTRAAGGPIKPGLVVFGPDPVEAFYPSTGGMIIVGPIPSLSVVIKADFQPLEEALRKLEQKEWERKGREIRDLIQRLEAWLSQ